MAIITHPMKIVITGLNTGELAITCISWGTEYPKGHFYPEGSFHHYILHKDALLIVSFQSGMIYAVKHFL